MIDGNEILVTHEYLDCRFEIDGNANPINLKPITTMEFEMVVGMDWLSKNKAHIIFDEKLLIIEPPGEPKIII